MSHAKKLINSELSSKCCRHRCALVLLRHCDRELSIASATEMPAVPSAARLFKSLPPHRRPQGTDIAAVAGWTVAGLATAIWLVQVSPAVMSCLPVAVFFFSPCFLLRIVFFVIVSSFCSSFVGRSPSTGSRRRSLRSNNLRNQITRTRILLTRSTAATCNLLHIHGLQLLGVMYISMQRMRSSSS